MDTDNDLFIPPTLAPKKRQQVVVDEDYNILVLYCEEGDMNQVFGINRVKRILLVP